MTQRQGTPTPVNPLAEFMDPTGLFKNPDQAKFMSGLVQALSDHLQKSVQTNQGAPHVILQSPNGQGFKLTVADDGTVQTANARS